MTRLFPVLLSGGTGTRLWPLSREALPKQLLALAGPDTLLQQTAARVSDPDLFEPVTVIANAEHRFVVAEQLRAAGLPSPRVVLEPFGRNTGPAAAVAALLALRDRPDAVVLLTPADHAVPDAAAFRSAVETGLSAARSGRFVLFGIRPTRPATGYGYMRLGPGGAVRPVLEFTEKPDAATAEAYLSSGEHAWNSGIFLLPAALLVEELGRLEPDLLDACRAALDGAGRDLDFLRLDPAAFARARSVSLDYAVMERTDKAVAVPVDFAWSDIGAWSALWEIGGKDADENVVVGDVLAREVEGCYLRSDDKLLAVSGVRDLVVVVTDDAVLVTSKAGDQDVRLLVEDLKRTGHEAATAARNVHRPWGSYRSIHRGDRFQVKCITVKPGAKLSLQKHFHRAEHWVVVNGTALVTRDGEEILLRENESTFLPLGCVHRLENPGRIPLHLIEVQSGPYLGEDDIVRLEDLYARD